MYGVFEKIVRHPERVTLEEIAWVISNDELNEKLFALADEVRQKYLGKQVYLRGIIEFSNYCRNDCLYCGIRASNKNVKRYRMSIDEIVERAKLIAEMGIKTVVLQSGEDPYYTTEMIGEMIQRIKRLNVAITLSIGERDFEEYEYWKNLGADRYLMRHETADEQLYEKLHPNDSFQIRKSHLIRLKQLGYETGAGSMVGLPGQNDVALAKDVLFVYELDADMVGIGPFIPHPDTPLRDSKAGDLTKVLKLIALTRLFLPDANIPATTALGTIHPFGRQLALKCGANVIMPNFTPSPYRSHYTLYPNKICIFEKDTACGECTKNIVRSIGYEVSEDFGYRRKNRERFSCRV
ncbi:[FeFe] hydrogenase H-cluster radical SAM maturase HydE [Thermotoga sp. Ku-13t]|uniref:[FeFe] hydrogenase H-cluster radical SAM maturase HydE n=1 Tax=Thermotoga sp. Ku-13t TaxID=1755813 RepID=UPI0013EA755A|nr:[FeFe] hydrogenase H-cluster radical SAM maturase HydE [Thermotoga sp. Ku-13t]KAF2958937.1 [FeFe] hydrogenase H-cluster radical SAM maturase HydE [Thermotoga sp. Ku-13t]